MKKSKFLRFMLLTLLVMLLGCTKKEPAISEIDDDDEESVEVVKEEKITSIPCVMLGDFYYEENSDGGFNKAMAALEGTSVQAPINEKNPDAMQPITKTDASKTVFVRINLEDDMENQALWAKQEELAVNAHPGCTYETGSDIFICEQPDSSTQGKTKLSTDMILAIYNEIPSSDKYPEADKFQKIKIRLGNAASMNEGFLKNIQLDQTPERVTLIQVRKKYNELIASGTAPNEVLLELNDTIEELRKWSDKRW